MTLAVSAAVAVVLNGRLLPTVVMARNLGGHIAVPLAVAKRLATTVSVDRQAGTIAIVRGEDEIVVHIGSLRAQVDGNDRAIALAPFAENGTIYVPLAPLVQTFGGRVRFDARTKNVYVVLTDLEQPLATMTPYVPTAPAVAPTQLFTPQPVETPRPQLSGNPRPRRTPIPAVPSVP